MTGLQRTVNYQQYTRSSIPNTKSGWTTLERTVSYQQYTINPIPNTKSGLTTLEWNVIFTTIYQKIIAKGKKLYDSFRMLV